MSTGKPSQQLSPNATMKYYEKVWKCPYVNEDALVSFFG